MIKTTNRIAISKLNALLLISILLSGCASIQKALAPKVSLVSVSGEAYILKLPYDNHHDNAKIVKDKFFRNFTKEHTKFAWGKVSSDYSYKKYIELKKIEDTSYIIRDGLYTNTSSRGRRLGDSYTEYELIISCNEKTNYVECVVSAINGKRIVDHHYAKEFAPLVKDGKAIRRLLIQGYNISSTVESKYELDIFKGEAIKLGLNAHINSSTLTFRNDTVFYNISNQKIKNGYLYTINRNIYPAKINHNTVDYFYLAKKSSDLINKLMK